MRKYSTDGGGKKQMIQEHATPSYLMTGHRQIDSQHHELDQLIQPLRTVCEAQYKSGSDCNECSSEYRVACTNRLDDLLGNLLGFVVKHFSYEEKLMRQLPATPACRQHIEEHKFAHAEISSQLADLTHSLDREYPQQHALRLLNIISNWMGAHICSLDVQLAGKLQDAINTELDYDVKLAALLEVNVG